MGMQVCIICVFFGNLYNVFYNDLKHLNILNHSNVCYVDTIFLMISCSSITRMKTFKETFAINEKSVTCQLQL